MPRRMRLLISTMSFTLFILAAVPLYTELTGRSNIWWTPRAMLVPLGQSTDRVEIYARGEPLTDLLRAGRLRIVNDTGVTVLTAAEVGLRFNNWDRVRAGRQPVLLVAAAACGVAALMLVLSMTGRLADRHGMIGREGSGDGFPL